MSHITLTSHSAFKKNKNKALVLSAAFATAIISLGAISPAMAQKSLEITVTTSPTPARNPSYGDAHVLAIWLENTAGVFINTIHIRAALPQNGGRAQYLRSYTTAATNLDAIDATTSATLANHDSLTTSWDLLDANGNEIPAGDYMIKMETADHNTPANDPGSNNVGSFPFTKGTASETKNLTDADGFSAITFKLTLPNAADCGNGMIDSGETCDSAATGADACLTECADTTSDACMPNVLSGAAATCDAMCSIVEITACADGDGCCPEGCTVDGDNADADCVGGGGGNGANIEGGCSSSGGATGLGALLLLGLAVFSIRRRRQSVKG